MSYTLVPIATTESRRGFGFRAITSLGLKKSNSQRSLL